MNIQSSTTTKDLQKRIVLVTGAPRSGTTVVGNALALAPHTRALYEPMNPDSGDKTIAHAFAVPGKGGCSADDVDRLMRRVAALSLKLKPGVFDHEKGLRRLAKRIVGGQSRHSLRMARLSRHVDTIIWKDPFAPFVARQAIENFSVPVVVTVRPPLAVASSFKRLNWRFKIADINERLGGRYLSQQPMTNPSDIVEQSAVLWQMIYGELQTLHKEFPSKIHLVSMGGLIDHANERFKDLYRQLGLEYSPQAQAAIAAMFDPGETHKSAVPSGHPHTKNRDIRAANTYWSKVLSDAEIAAVRARTHDVEAYYDRHFRAASMDA